MILKACVPAVSLFYILLFVPEREIIPLAMVMTIIIPLIWIGLFAHSFTKYRWNRWIISGAIVLNTFELIITILDLLADSLGIPRCSFDIGTPICPWSLSTMIVSILILPLLVSVVKRPPDT